MSYQWPACRVEFRSTICLLSSRSRRLWTFMVLYRKAFLLWSTFRLWNSCGKTFLRFQNLLSWFSLYYYRTTRYQVSSLDGLYFYHAGISRPPKAEILCSSVIPDSKFEFSTNSVNLCTPLRYSKVSCACQCTEPCIERCMDGSGLWRPESSLLAPGYALSLSSLISLRIFHPY